MENASRLYDTLAKVLGQQPEVTPDCRFRIPEPKVRLFTDLSYNGAFSDG